MGRTASVTPEQFAVIANAIKAEGLRITSRLVRDRLGNVGSMGTINKLLQEWNAGQERHITSSLTLPPALQKSILDFMDSELLRARQTLETDLADQQREMADLANENEKQFAMLEENSETIESLRNEIATHQGRAGQLESDLTASKDEVVRERTSAELARTELAKAQLRLEAMPRLESDLSTARASIESERTAKIFAEQAAAVAVAMLDSVNESITKADVTIAKLIEKSSTLEQQIKELFERATKAEAGLEAMVEKLATSENFSKQLLMASEQRVTLAESVAKKSIEEAAELRGAIAKKSHMAEKIDADLNIEDIENTETMKKKVGRPPKVRLPEHKVES